MEVTGKSGDGGFDGKGNVRVSGLLTGSFTREAIREATRDGAPPIDLIDGDVLCDMKELKLGIETKLTETMEIRTEWFKGL